MVGAGGEGHMGRIAIEDHLVRVLIGVLVPVGQGGVHLDLVPGLEGDAANGLFLDADPGGADRREYP